MFFFDWFGEQQLRLPPELVYAHTGLAGILCVIDIVQVLMHPPCPKQATQQRPHQAALPETPQREQASVGELLQMPNKAFELDNRSRRKFMMTFTGRTRWPAVLDVPAQKKST